MAKMILGTPPVSSVEALNWQRNSNSVLKPAIVALAMVLSSSLAFAADDGETLLSTESKVESQKTDQNSDQKTDQKSDQKSDQKKEKKTDAKESKESKGSKKKKTDSKKLDSKDKKKGDKAVNPHVIMETSLGNVEIELFEDKAPISVANFLKYTDSGYYNGTIFHRVIPNFMIQGGGFTEKMDQKKTEDQIKNEANNGLKNDRGTLAMARTAVVDSATSQFFVNVKDNDFLNFTAPNPAQYGYAVFGKVVSGMDVVDKIKEVPTGTKGMHSDVPNTPVLIKSMKRK